MRKLYSISIILASVFIILSCSTFLTIGTTGTDTIAIPPYNEDKNVNMAFSIQSGVSTGIQPIFFAWVFPYSTYSQGNFIIQFKNITQRKLHSTSTLSIWNGYFYDPQTDKIIEKENRQFYGSTATFRIGYEKKYFDTVTNIPSFELLYSYEAGPFFQTRNDLIDLDESEFKNLKPYKHNFIISIIPFDYTFLTNYGDFRITNSYGWNDSSTAYKIKLIPIFLKESFDIVDALFILSPIQYEIGFSYKPKNIKLYTTANVNIYTNINTYKDTNMIDTNLGLSIGFGYLF